MAVRRQLLPVLEATILELFHPAAAEIPDLAAGLLDHLAGRGFHVAPTAGGYLVEPATFGEFARRIERLHADARLCEIHGWTGPGSSAARARDSLLGVLHIILNRRRRDLHDLMLSGRLVEEFSDARARKGTCALCQREDVPVIDAKHTPKEPEFISICRSTIECDEARADAAWRRAGERGPGDH
jgi:hypothetical protein